MTFPKPAAQGVRTRSAVGGATVSALLAGVLLTLGGCKPAGVPPATGPAQVTAQKVAAHEAPATMEFVGQTESDHEVQIRSRVSGFLIKRDYVEGAVVKTGQVLFEIDHEPFQVQVDAAKAELAQQNARLARAKANLARVQPLAEQNALSKKDLDDAVANEHEAAAAVDGAKANLAAKQLDLSYTYVRSPLDGVASFASQMEGAYVNAQNSLLTTVSSLSPMRVNFSVSENQMLQLQNGRKSGRLTPPSNGQYEVEMTLSDGSTYPQRGRITFADSTYSQQTGTFLVRAEVQNAQSQLRPGQFVRARVLGASFPSAIVVSQQAVMHGPKGDFVYVVEPADKDTKEGAQYKAEQRPVTVGETVGDQWLVNEGLRDGDNVVVDGAMKLSAGAPIGISKQLPPAAAAAGTN
ncbi:efflux RND transporter periplasmic adaptor subunit [Paraburkholderia haematera]|jgi:RND family efflux transporter, MFP subunit|uniref:Multidrug export protein AcrE n=1 Tax=Paraburkholderia haematera TaxID=2793077 RepID=A0ABM8SCV3_9BURK|nr:efflux RND transporter periplasmic adaptor subunit [Paraburkholderia haematera]CAE6801641.1 Multidrug export protein AcrE [Paraburkholderia haematera]